MFLLVSQKTSEKHYMKEMLLAQAFCHMVFLQTYTVNKISCSNVQYHLLLAKLEHYGFWGITNEWFLSVIYLTESNDFGHV